MASIIEPTSQVISRPTSSETEIYRRYTSDYEQGAVEEDEEEGEEEEEEEEEEETDYETYKQIEASGFIKGLRPWLGNQALQPVPKVIPNNLIESKIELLMLEQKLVMVDYLLKF